MKVIVIGGAGYLGSILVEHLLKSGHQVTVLDNFRYSTNQLLSLCFNDKFNVINGDVRDSSLVKMAISNQDVIVSLAAMVGQRLCESNSKEAWEINVNSVEALLKIKESKQKLIFASTHSCYGNISFNSICNEESAIRPLTVYSHTKEQAESLVLKDDNSLVLRIGTIFGVSPRMRMDLSINNLVFRAMTDKFAIIENGNAFRNYIHVRDVATAINFTINNFSKMKGEIFNIGNQELNLTLTDICKSIQKVLPEFIFYERENSLPYDKRNYQVSMNKIAKLGWQAKIKLETGITELIKAYKMIKPLGYVNL